MHAPTNLYQLAGVAAFLALAVTGCDTRDAGPVAVVDRNLAPAPDTTAGPHPDAVLNSPEIARWLAGLKEATAPFHDLATAAAAGWNTRITGCMAMPDSGGMGFHYANTALIDGTLKEFAPQLLLYAPRAGRLHLVAVEYIVPFTFRPADADPPELHGIKFHQNFAFGLWILHAWVWQHNPAGMFEDWNPDVSCTSGS